MDDHNEDTNIAQTRTMRACKNVPRELFLMILHETVSASTGRAQVMAAVQIDADTRYRRTLRETVCKRLARLKLAEEKECKHGGWRQSESRMREVQETFYRCLFGTTGRMMMMMMMTTGDDDLLLRLLEPVDFYCMLSRSAGGLSTSGLKDLLDRYHRHHRRRPPYTATDVALYTQICVNCGPVAARLLSYLIDHDFSQLYHHHLRSRLAPSHRNALILASLEGMSYHSNLRDAQIETSRGSHIASIVDCICTNQHVRLTARAVMTSWSLAGNRLALSEYLAKRYPLPPRRY